MWAGGPRIRRPPAACVLLEFFVVPGSRNFSRVRPVHAADFLGRVTAMWLSYGADRRVSQAAPVELGFRLASLRRVYL